MRATITNTILLINGDDACRSSVDFGPARNVVLERVSHPWRWPLVKGRSVVAFDLPDWFVIQDTGLGRPVSYWETHPSVTLTA